MAFVQDLSALSELLDSSQVDRESNATTAVAPTPGSIGPSQIYKNVKVPDAKPIKDPKEIWDPEEVEETVEDDIDDGRICPTYEFYYKQAVETQDAFLGMGDKDPSSTQCEDIVLRIELPGTSSVKDLDLDVKPTYIKLYSTKYKLTMYLPHKVDDQKSNAKWDATKEELKVTLRIIRAEL
mmetsp:Transcript_14704/g.41387  ORF Transcript_14704/g.41387 Transcript_14704/m.41387 type:complete len:181 (+) Transcript_14704:107-649(+)|eukprot:CAMPEP_0117655330 /NCGR_PEP_ID=MMETSP0804-20121206/4222_1 /TAXON_ID=1074897 /ORGANISM="Tetraselmis astigmatica, Strain CCMP880" /LENGTH=180 /DNA_ID=CAMNT_0005461675 /DNA_START=35 /DNA_END=577 /DNA_ORIENTATION=-